MWDSTTVDLGSGRSLHAAQRGSGEDLLLLHGAMTTNHDWIAGPAAALSEDRRVTAIDRPGHGLSRRPRFVGTPRDQAGQIADGLDRLGVGPALVIGHSFGALVALALAERFPERVAGLVLVSPLVFPEPRLLEHGLIAPRSTPVFGPLLSRLGHRSGFDRAAVEWIQAVMFSPARIPAGWKSSFPYDQVLDPDVLVHEGEDSASILPLSPAGTIDLGRIEIPVQVLIGTEDRVVEQERQGKALARLLPDGRLTVVDGAGHMLHHSHSDVVLAAVEGVTA
ncbi:MAG TPA: alpha/beta hydrolase [Allosphingosinicella sp.]|jgi:pimeloyl-ACP methyl ester carboxylesterase|nr:alpha/beta hydrolase [Allosphingosinicella sp.]